MTETWKPVTGYEGIYEVSDQGRVRSLARSVPRGAHTLRVAERIMRPSGTTYAVVMLRKPGVPSKTEAVHVLVLTAFVGPRPDRSEACHGPGGPRDNRLANLRWDTVHQNNLDKVRHGTHHEASKPRCKRRHLLVEPNLCAGDLRRGWRRCKSCHNARSRVTRTGVGDVDTLADAYYRDLGLEAA